jgi:hypothetical protein
MTKACIKLIACCVVPSLEGVERRSPTLARCATRRFPTSVGVERTRWGVSAKPSLQVPLTMRGLKYRIYLPLEFCGHKFSTLVEVIAPVQPRIPLPLQKAIPFHISTAL